MATIGHEMKPQLVPQPTPDRPLTVMDIIDGSFNILRVRPKTVVAIVASFVLPSQLIGAWVSRSTFTAFDDFDWETGEFADGEAPAGFTGGSDALFSVGAVLGYIVLPFIGVALTHLVQGWQQKQDRGALECVVFTLKKTHIIAGAFLLAKLLQVISFVLLIIPGFFMTAWLMVVAPVIAIEGLGPIASVRRSIALTRRRTGAAVGLLLSIIGVTYLLSTALGTVPTLAAFLLNDWGWVAFFALNMLAASVTTLLGVGCSVLLYGDLVNRTEGDDIRRQLETRLAANAG